MQIDSLNDVISGLENIHSREDIDKLIDNNNGLPVIMSSSQQVREVNDYDLVDLLEQIEFSASYYLLFENGLVDRKAESKLNKSGFMLKKVADKELGFNHSVGNEKFVILF